MKKCSTRPLKPLTWLKYGILLILVGLLPVLVTNDVGLGDPFFCKYLCPQGVLEGAIPMALTNACLLYTSKTLTKGLVMRFFVDFCGKDVTILLDVYKRQT